MPSDPARAPLRRQAARCVVARGVGVRAKACRCAPCGWRGARAGAGAAPDGYARRWGDANGLLQSQGVHKGSHDDLGRGEALLSLRREKSVAEVVRPLIFEGLIDFATREPIG